MSAKAIRERITSVRNIAKITRAMEAVAATKMRRSQEAALRARPFALSSLEMLENLLIRTPDPPPLLAARPVRNSCLLIITSDKGLAGAFNAAVLRKAEDWISEKEREGKICSFVTVGRKAHDYTLRKNRRPLENFTGLADAVRLEETLRMGDFLIKGYLGDLFDEVYAASTAFRSTLVQEARVRRILPVTKEGIREMAEGILPERGRYAASSSRASQSSFSRFRYEYRFEPSPEDVLSSLLPQLLKTHVHHLILESTASEHSARMVAMKNASDNAEDLIWGLELLYNKARQAGITREILEVTAGKEALEGV
jgi:F-type H+-transporting ATPase subunit gamma